MCSWVATNIQLGDTMEYGQIFLVQPLTYDLSNLKSVCKFKEGKISKSTDTSW